MGSDRSLEILAGVLGVATLLLSVVILVVFPADADLAGGWKTPIIAFELALNEGDLAFLAGPANAALRDAMDAGHRVDFAFPFAYAGLLAALLLRHARRGCQVAWLGVIAAVVVIGADIYENAVLLRMTSALAAQTSTDDLLALLRVATWTKWGGIGLAAGTLFVPEWRRSPAVGVLLFAAATTTAAAATSPAIAPLGEGMALVVTVTLGVVAVRAAWRLFRPLPEDQCRACAPTARRHLEVSPQT